VLEPEGELEECGDGEGGAGAGRDGGFCEVGDEEAVKVGDVGCCCGVNGGLGGE
jgi:hypothetical protein